MKTMKRWHQTTSSLELRMDHRFQAHFPMPQEKLLKKSASDKLILAEMD